MSGWNEELAYAQESFTEENTNQRKGQANAE